jgi:hypothetical protein
MPRVRIAVLGQAVHAETEDYSAEKDANMKTRNSKRTDKHEPTPEEVLDYIAAASRDLTSNWWIKHPNHPMNFYDQEAAYRAVSLGDIRDAIAAYMAKRGEYFTSAYRHANSGLHETVHSILGSIVSLNDLIERKRLGAAS